MRIAPGTSPDLSRAQRARADTTLCPDTHARALALALREACGFKREGTRRERLCANVYSVQPQALLQWATSHDAVPLAGTYRENLMIENAVRLEARDGPGTVTIFSELWVPPPQTHTRTRQPPPGSPEYCEYPPAP